MVEEKERVKRTSSVGSEDLSPLLNGPVRNQNHEKEWPIHPTSLLQTIVGFVGNLAIDTFFSKVEVANEENIPVEGPVILFGNHNNQFVDGFVMSRAADRNVSFIAAKVSYDKPVIGDLLKAMDAVPVARPQDSKKEGLGHLTNVDVSNRKLYGDNETKFLSQVEVGSFLGNKEIGQFCVETIESDCEVTFKKLRIDTETEEFKDVKPDLVKNSKYSITPKINQTEVFATVTKALGQGKCIGIFPEGGSHDRTQMLPLKVGVAIMALDALAAGIPVSVVPVGLNYFSGHVFRSTAFVEVGKALSVSTELVELYKDPKTKKHACSQLLEEMRSALEMVTMQAPDYETLKIIRTARRLYQGNVNLTPKEYVELNTRFTSAFQKWKDNDDFQKLMNDIREYLEFARSLGLKDKEVQNLRPLGSFRNMIRSVIDIVKTYAMIMFYVPLVIPGLILNLPLIYYVKKVMPKEVEKALKASSVKLAARDVAASLQIMNAIKITPILHLIYSCFWIVFFYFSWPYYSEMGTIGHLFLSYAWFLLPLAFSFLGPWYAFYICPSIIETTYRRWRLLPRYVFSVKSFFQSSKRQPAELLRYERKKLIVRTQDLVETMISSYPEWDQERIINRAKMLKKRSKSLRRIAKEGDLSQGLPARPSFDDLAGLDNLPSRPSFEKNLDLASNLASEN